MEGKQYSWRFKLISWLFMICFVYGMVELCCFGTLYLFKRFKRIEYKPDYKKFYFSKKHIHALYKLMEGQTKYVIFDKDLGWTHKGNGESPLYQTNSQGIRGHKEFSHQLPKGKIRVSSFGDSFTHCDDVKNNETWQHFLEESVPNLESLNFGVGGYGTDQAFLRYQNEGKKFDSHIVFIGYMTENLFRNVNRFRPFYYQDTGRPLTKPRYELVRGKLTLIENPIKEVAQYQKLIDDPQIHFKTIGENDFYFSKLYKKGHLDLLPSQRLWKLFKFHRPHILTRDGMYNSHSEAYQVTLGIMEKFYKTVLENGSLPILLVFPYYDDFERFLKKKSKRYSHLLSELDRRGIQYIDLLDAFKDLKKEYDFSEIYIRHYTPFGNQKVADFLKNYIYENSLHQFDEIEQKISIQQQQLGLILD